MMYLLLRNNKQSGPYSLEQLKSMGLKAYDLVWVEGKSAAWRYPCEIAELSAFAPVVEEQPFDRFFKRPDATKANGVTSTTPTAASQASVSSPVLVTTPRMTGEASGVAGKRIIYVNMPAGKAPAAQQESSKNTPIDSTPIPPAFIRTNTPEALQIPPAVLPVGAESLGQADEEEALIGEILAQQHRRKKTPVLRPLMVGFGIIALLAAGMFIGLSLNKDGSLNFKDGWNLLPKLVQTTATVPASQPAAVTTQQQPAPVVTMPVTQSAAEQPADTAAVSIASTTENEIPVPVKTVHTPGAGREKLASNKPITSVSAASPKDSATIISMAHKESPARSEERQDNEKESARTNIANMVSVDANTFTVGTFGGISDLQLTVANRSPYPLDLVVVEIQYIQANKKIYKTENLYFRGIAAGSALMQEAPESSRGIKVQYKIVMINSKELGLSYSGI